MYSYADEGQIIIVITTNIVSNTVGYSSPISAAEISLILDPRGIRHTRTILLYLLSLSHTHTYPFIQLHTHTKHTHTYIDPRRSFCGFSFVSNNSIVVTLLVSFGNSSFSRAFFRGICDQSGLIEETELTNCSLVLGNVHSCDYLDCQFSYFVQDLVVRRFVQPRIKIYD